MDYRQRQSRLFAALSSQGVETMLITHLANIRYLCGFTGSAGVLAATNRAGKRRLAFFTDGRYTQQAREQVRGASVHVSSATAMAAALAQLLKDRKHVTIGFEAEHTSVAARAALGKAAGPRARLQPTSGMVETLRMIKEPAEVAQIRAAVHLASEVFEAVLPDIKPGMPESLLAAEIEYLCRRLGAEGMSFDTLISSGKRSALPHGVAGPEPLPGRGFVIMDFGVILGGYCSDMTRTVHLGRPDKAALETYNAVLEAQLAGIAAVRAGAESAEVDYAARKVLVKEGLGRYFTHSTGHGVGLEIHERPGLRKRPPAAGKGPQGRRKGSSAHQDALQAGMVITIEPGAYIPGKGGVRIEDMVLVTESGCEVLTQTRKDLIVI